MSESDRSTADGGGGGATDDSGAADSDGPKQVDDPDYHSRNHTAAQTCGWTKNAMTGDGKCYKYVFYGIESHRCIQMTPVVKCNERCVFCWRDHAGHAYELDGVEWDDPAAVADASVELQREILSGYGGNDQVPDDVFEQAMEPRHVAISLDGEPTLYPYLPELIEEFHERDITTFLVSNGTNPEMLERCEPTQLYVSVDAADRKTFDETVKAVEDGAWESLIDTMDVLAGKTDTRTVIRTTLVKDHNMHYPEWYAAMCDRAEADFVEMKAYMHVGHSRGRLDRDSMPSHDEVKAFTEEVQEFLPEHTELKEVPESHVAMLATEKETWVEKLEKSSEFWEDDPLVSY